MRPISKALNERMNNDPEYKKCIRREWLEDHECRGRITREHAIIFAGRQLDEYWAIIPICAYAHSVDEFQDGGILDKHINEWIALNRATDQEIEAISKAVDYSRRRDYLNTVYVKRKDGKLLQKKD